MEWSRCFPGRKSEAVVRKVLVRISILGAPHCAPEAPPVVAVQFSRRADSVGVVDRVPRSPDCKVISHAFTRHVPVRGLAQLEEELVQLMLPRLRP
jgi:hypothetical protein